MSKWVLVAGVMVLLGSPWSMAEAVKAEATPSAKTTQGELPVNALVASANAALREQRYGDAMDQFEALLKAAPKSDEARHGEAAAATAWALAEIKAQHPDRGMEILDRAIEQVPNDPELLTDFGVEATALGQFPIAEQALQAADKLRPHDPKTVYGLARLAVEGQHLPEAETELKAYLELRPQDASAYFGLGHVYAMQQRYDDARNAFEQSIRLQPKQTESYYQVGQLDLQAHKDADAQGSFAKVLERMSSHAGALTGMGEIALHAKEYAKAEQYLAAAEKSDPKYQTPHYFRGLALARLGRKDEAEQEMKLGDSRPHVSGPAGSAGDAKQTPGQQPPGS